MQSNHPAVMHELSKAMAAFPELRVGQLLDNALTEYRKAPDALTDGGDNADLFYMSDLSLANALQVYTSKHGKREHGTVHPESTRRI